MGCGSCGTGGGCGAGCGGNGSCSTGGGCGSSRKGTAACPALRVYDWLNDLGIAGPEPTVDVAEIQFKGGRKGFFGNASNFDIHTGDYVIVEADRGVDFGTVHLTGELVRLRLKSIENQPERFPQVVRKASLADIDVWESIKEKETETFLIGRRAIDKMNLPMKLVDVEWQFDGNKVTFYFTAEHRVDFRRLVRQLASEFKTRVELRQIGARDEAARIGGIGSCGRELCCSTWLQEFKPVSTQAAKAQNLPLNPVKLSGQCGRLKCCLNYELEQYMEALRNFPPIDMEVRTEYGRGIVQKVDIFKSLVWVYFPERGLEPMPVEVVWKHIDEKETLRVVGTKRADFN